MRQARRAFEKEAGADPRILDFLDRLCEPLERTLTDQEMEEYRLQALGHLEMMAADLHEYSGFSPGEAVEAALRGYGRPDLLAIGLLDERCKGTRPIGFARSTRSATLWSFVWFGVAAALFTVGSSLALMWPGQATFQPMIEPLAWVLPIGAGYLTGRSVPTGNLTAALPALAVLVLYAAIAALLMQPYSEATRAELCESLLAVPLGCASIFVSALLRRRPIRIERRGLVA